MRTETDQASRMRRYLLGVLPESEQIALEQRFFADGEMLEQIQEIEHELIDGYVRGQLPRAEREQFERHYLAAPGHRERVAFARELLNAADLPTAAPMAQPAESFGQRFLAALRARQFALGAVTALAALLLVGGLWLASQRARWRQQLARSEAERAAEQQRVRDLEAQIAQQSERQSQLTAELDRLREEQRRAGEQTAQTARPTLLSFTLLSSVRGGSEQQVLRVPPGTDQVRLQMKVENDASRRYHVSIRPVDGGAGWRQGPVSALTGKSGTTITVTVPANKLTRGDYILTLSAITPNGATEELNRYFFRVAGK